MEIKLELGNWQYNAGIVGLYSILEEHKKDSVRVEKDTMTFDSEELEGFEEKYFNYMIKTYEKVLSWYKIVSFEERANLFKVKIEDESITNKELDEINNYIKDVVKKYIKSNSYIPAYEFIKGDINPLTFEKELKPITLKKKESILDKKAEIGETLNSILKVIEYFKLESAKKYVGAKNVIYTILKNGWDGVCFLNRNSKEKDVYKDLKNYFVTPVEDYLKEEKNKYKYHCFICDRKIKNFDSDFSFLVNTGFDTNRKPSHVWEFTNDVAMCPICKLVYSCVPAGFSYLYGAGLFVNSNTSLENLVKINDKIKYKIYRGERLADIYSALSKELRENQAYELEDIQLVRFENGRYYFNIISKNMIRVMKDSKSEFEWLAKDSFKENGENFKLNDEVLKRLLNNENLFSLIHRALYSKLSIKENNYISELGIYSMIKINFRMLKGVGYMENKEIDIVARGRGAGIKLKEKYKHIDARHKIQGICYRILNGLKTNNMSMVLDTIFNCYMYCHLEVPKIITDMIGDEESFREIGYAFVGGMLGIEFEKNENENKEN